jgi:hypothetical protein
MDREGTVIRSNEVELCKAEGRKRGVEPCSATFVCLLSSPFVQSRFIGYSASMTMCCSRLRADSTVAMLGSLQFVILRFYLFLSSYLASLHVLDERNVLL